MSGRLVRQEVSRLQVSRLLYHQQVSRSSNNSESIVVWLAIFNDCFCAEILDVVGGNQYGKLLFFARLKTPDYKESTVATMKVALFIFIINFMFVFFSMFEMAMNKLPTTL